MKLTYWKIIVCVSSKTLNRKNIAETNFKNYNFEKEKNIAITISRYTKVIVFNFVQETIKIL